MDFDDAVARFCTYQLTARGRARTTVDQYGSELEQFSELAKVKQLSGLDRMAILRWLNKLAELQLAPASRAKKLSALRSFVGWALEFGLLDADPIPQEVSLPASFKLPYALTEAEVTAIINAAAEGAGPKDIRDHAIIETLYATGMRVSELCTLELDSLQLGEGFAVVTGKGDKQRLVPLGQHALDAISRWLSGPRAQVCSQAAAHREVFLSQRGPISRSMVYRIVQKYARLAGGAQRQSAHLPP